MVTTRQWQRVCAAIAVTLVLVVTCFEIILIVRGSDRPAAPVIESSEMP